MTVYLTIPVIGGLGNQLFVIGAGIKLQLLVPDVKLIFVRENGTSERPTHWDKFLKDSPKILQFLVESLPDANWKTCGNYSNFAAYTDLSSTIRENARENISSRCEGYFQNWRHLPPREVILDFFNVIPKQITLRDRFNYTDACALHFRLGDYKNLSYIYPILPDEYYRNALQRVREEKPHLKTLLIFNEREDQATICGRMKSIVTSDDFQIVYVSELGLEDWEEMILMSLCEAVVMANSSFSWWGAYLNANDSPTIIFPSQWINTQNRPQEGDINLPSWVRY